VPLFARPLVDKAARDEALKLLRDRGYDALKVIRLDSPGDSQTVAAEVLYVTLDKKPMRAYIAPREGKDPHVWVIEGWDVPDGYEVVAVD
jgi:hypothetical protein